MKRNKLVYLGIIILVISFITINAFGQTKDSLNSQHYATVAALKGGRIDKVKLAIQYGVILMGTENAYEVISYNFEYSLLGKKYAKTNNDGGYMTIEMKEIIINDLHVGKRVSFTNIKA